MIKTILLAEDDRGTALLVKTQLERNNYKVLVAYNGLEALAIIRSEKVDLLITDVVMPEMDGPALVEKVKLDRPDIKVLFISGYAEMGFRQQAKESGALQFLAKPFSLKQLAGKVKDMLEEVG